MFELGLERVGCGFGLCVYGYVVMPEHMHHAGRRAQIVKAGCVAAPDWRGRALLAEALLRPQHPESCPVRGKASFISIATR